MSSVLPKFKIYMWLSIICLMINLCVFVGVVIADNTADVNNFLDNSDTDDVEFNRDLPNNYNATTTNFAISVGTSFIPFFSLIPLSLMGSDLPSIMTTFVGLVIGIIGAVQIFLLSIIILNLAPKVLGSGFDV